MGSPGRRAVLRLGAAGGLHVVSEAPIVPSRDFRILPCCDECRGWKATFRGHALLTCQLDYENLCDAADVMNRLIHADASRKGKLLALEMRERAKCYLKQL
jgi:hypothetical protein